MPAIARSLGCLLLAAALSFSAAESTLDRLAKLASNLTEGNGQGAASVFDSSLKQFGEIQANLDAITAQSEIVCAIDVVAELEKDGIHTLDTDWVLQLRSKGEHGKLENRRERIQLEMRQVKGKWKITAIDKVQIFAPLQVR